MGVYQAIFIVCVSFVLCSAQRKELKAGDGCRLENRQKGICRPLSKCAVANKNLEENNEWPLVCAYGEEVVVCCDETDHSVTTTTTTTPAPTTRRTVPRAPPGIISRQKCEQYSRWLPKLIGLYGAAQDSVPGKCGAGIETFIYHGEDAGRLEFPHMAHLGFTENDDDEPVWSCGGSLISDKFIITAAHCLRKKDGSKVTHIRLGTGDHRSEIIVKVKEMIPHPNYKKGSVYDDIALLELDRTIKFTDFRRPACLQANKHFINKNGVASGWGATEKDGRGSAKLQKVTLPFLTNAECRKTYVTNPSLPRGIDDRTQVCAGGVNLKMDTCQGDSGGPLQAVLKQPHCMYSVIGLTSFGIKCGIVPGVYTRVSAYLDWIEPIVWPQG